MADKIYFGVPGAIEEIRAPESGMSFNNNVDAEVTQLVSGGRSVYRAPTAYKSFNLSWRSNSAGLRHLINMYNGQFGSGPFYLTDPTASEENILPSRWGNSWQLAYQSNGWGKPVVQDASPTTSPAPQLPRTNKIVKFTQALSGSSVPTSGVVKTRHIRVPGKPYYLSAYGSATGGAGIIVRVYNDSTQAWTFLQTFTTLTGAATQVIPANNTTYSMIELDIFLPLGSTLTLYGMCLGSIDHTTLSFITKTNYSPSPRGLAGATVYWNVSAGTGGTATLTGFDTFYPYRKNYSANPQATSATNFGSYITGTGETGTTSYLTGQVDGPLPSITNYARWSVTAAKTSNSTGWSSVSAAHRNAPAGVTGETVTVSIYIRYTGAGTLTGRMRATAYNASVAVGSNDGANSVTLTSGVWTRVDATVVATGDFATVGWWFYHLTAQIPAAGSTLDVTGVLIEKNVSAPGNYFDGSFIQNGDYNYLWEGTAMLSISQERLPALGPDNRLGFVQYRQTVSGTGGFVGPFMRDTTGYNTGTTGDVRYAYAWVRVNQSRSVRMSCSFKDGASIDVGAASATNYVTLQPGVWYLFSSGAMTATGPFSRFQQWISTVTSSGVPLPPEFTFDIISWITDKPSDYFDGDFTDHPESNQWYRWTSGRGTSASVLLYQAPTDFMPVAQGVGALQFESAQEGTLTSKTVDRVGLSVDMIEVQNVERYKF